MKKDRNHLMNNKTVENYNKLPDIWHSLGREVRSCLRLVFSYLISQIEPGQSLSKVASESCSVKSLSVDLRRLGWGRRIISPHTYQANYCSGSCSFPLTQVCATNNFQMISNNFKCLQMLSNAFTSLQTPTNIFKYLKMP